MLRRRWLLVLVIVDLLLLAPLLGGKILDAQPNDDLISFLNAARRMAESGTPYLPLHLDPSLPLRPGWELADAYVYSPLIAQLMAPLAALSHTTAWNIWTLVSVAAVIGAVAAGFRLAHARVRSRAFLFGLGLVAISMPIASGFRHGRSEPLAAAAIGLALLGIAPGAAAAFATILRVPAGAFGLPLLIAARSRWRYLAGAAVAAAVIVAVGALFAPQAWYDYLLGGALPRTIGGNLGLGLYDDAPHALVAFLFFYVGAIPETYDSAVDLVSLGDTARLLISAVRLVEIAGAIALFTASVRWAREPRRRHAAAAAAIVGGLLLGGLFWDYHNLPLLPIAVATYLIGSRGVRRQLAVACLATVVPLLLFDATVLSIDPLTGRAPIIFWPLGRISAALTNLPVGLLIVDAARRTLLPRPSRIRERS